MKQIGTVLTDMIDFVEKQVREREIEIRKRMGDETEVHTWVANTYGIEFAALFPEDLSVDEFATTVTDGAIDQTRARLKLCATCPPHGGACDNEYLSNHGEVPRWDREKGLRLEKWCDRWPEHILRKKLSSSGVGERYLGARFGTYAPVTPFQKEAKALCEQYAHDFKRGTTNTNLILVGANTGVGKTHLAIAVLADLLSRYRMRTAWHVFVPDFLERIRRSYSSHADGSGHLVEQASNVDLLVLDDLMAQRTTDWVREQLVLIADARWGAGLPTIITTNTGPDELAAAIGPRVTTRFFGNMFAAPLDGPDRRLAKKKD